MSVAHRILIVDDEPAIRKVFHDALMPRARPNSSGLEVLEEELFGDRPARSEHNSAAYELTSVASGEAAVEAVRLSLEQKAPFGVVFLDMRMPPGINGAVTAKAVRALDPLVNIVIVTGYSDLDISEIAADVLPADKLFFIAKPFQVAEIRQQAAALSARWSHETAMVRELQKQNRDLQVAARHALEARIEAEKANVAKSSFLANISHELRTPLNAIIGFSDIMTSELYGPLGDPRYLDYSREINTSGNGLLSAINDIIDTARLELGKVELVRESFDAFDCVMRVVVDLGAYARGKGVTVNSPSAPPSALPLNGDHKRTHQIVFGILHNAIKFTPSAGRVDVAVRRAGDDIVIEIHDTGPGIAPELVEAAKHAFTLGDNVFARTHGGLGLGLTLASRLIALHNGRMEFATEPGDGTTVRLYFPAAAAAVCAA